MPTIVAHAISPRTRLISLAMALLGLVSLTLGVAPGLLFRGPNVGVVRGDGAAIVQRFDPISNPGQAAYFAVEPSGALVVADRKQQVIRRFDQAGHVLSTWGPRVGDMVFQDIAGIAVVGMTWFVIERVEPRIIALDAAGVPTGTIALGPQGAYGPSGLAADGDGNLYVADTGNGRILVYSSRGQFVRTIGSRGQQVGQLSQPIALAIGPDGAVVIADWENSRVARWDSTGQATGAGEIGFRPWGVVVDAAGRSYVIDPDDGRIHVLSPNGAPVAVLAETSTVIHQLTFPSQLGLSADGRTMYVLGHDGLAVLSIEQTLQTITDTAPAPLSSRMLIGGGLLALLVAAWRARPPWVRLAQSAWRDRWSRRWPTTASNHAPSSRWPTSDRDRRLELLGVIVILAVAFFLRAHDLELLPHGLHGDEADTGLEAQRILKEGWIGLYSPLALGRPTGPLYLSVLPVLWLGNTVLAVRTVPLVMGVLTVFVLYVVTRRSLGAPIALLAAAALAVMEWHIHLSRIAFHPATWGLFIVLATGALLEAIRGARRWWWWVIGGVLCGAGVYQYQAAWLMLGVFGVAIAVQLGAWLADDWRTGRSWAALPPLLAAAAPCLVGVLIGVLPMAVYAADPGNGYFNSFELVSSLTKPEYQQLPNAWERALYLAGRYVDFWRRVCWAPRLDSIDGTGETPLVPLLQLALAATGLLVALRWWREPLARFSVLLVLLAPLASVVTLDGPARRSFALVPFLAILTALGAFGLVRLARRRRWLSRTASVGVALVLVVVGYQNLRDYFGVFADSADGDRWVFAQELTNASTYMAGLPSQTHVYFYSDRWGVTYETARYLAQNIVGEDRSTEFGVENSTRVDLSSGPVAFVLIGRYRPLLQELEAEYPGGRAIYGGSSSRDPTFIAYEPAAF